ncbi:hypothetical protein [Candidatus Odyssella acanthamoebae]|uniref:Uncharacterized protein n=1 Tax=Candidatus Odyssella acanthamoebae TaxID=91604 RepID=A0A077AWY6_9PROT|nr:hypothetical protein [Candidatus Paracaedibacter acanthamoebae]AIK96143.1 hypothetical protein ID47_04375 [Candidatus Paracaedibacter acanthamoebae]
MKKIIYWFVLALMVIGNSLNASDGGSSPSEQSDKNHALNFVMEKLTDDNVGFWENYKKAMLRIGINYGKNQQIQGDYLQATKGFQNAIDAFKKGEGDVWIAYAISAKEEDIYDTWEKMARIEICMTVTTSPGIPIVTHMGIFKTPLRDLSKEIIQNAETIEAFQDFGIVEILKKVTTIGPFEAKPRLSLPLHKFAAQSMLRLHPEKKVMMTAPLKVMYDSLESTFKENFKKISNIEHVHNQYILSSGSQVIMKLSDNTLVKAPWLKKVTFLPDLFPPKIAIDLHIIADYGEIPPTVHPGDQH